MIGAEDAEGAEAQEGLAERYVEAQGEEIRADDEAKAQAEEKAGEIQEAIDSGETSREDIEANWADGAEAQDRRVDELGKEWEIDEGLIQRLDAILDNPDASPEDLECAAELKGEAEARIEGYKAELDEIAADRECVEMTREALGWADGADREDGDDADWVPEPEDAEGGDAPETGADVAAAPGDGVETPQNERGHTNLSPAEEEVGQTAADGQADSADTSGNERNEKALREQWLLSQRQNGR